MSIKNTKSKEHQDINESELKDLISYEREDAIKEMFDTFDENHDGYISEKELLTVLEKLNLKTSNVNHATMYKLFKKYGDKNKLDYTGFRNLVKSLPEQEDPKLMNAYIFWQIISDPGDAKIIDIEKQQQLELLFNTIDADKDGFICADELVNGLKKLEFPDEHTNRRIVACLMEKTGKDRINLSEFVDLTKNLSSLDDLLKSAFDFFDSDKDGYITVDELINAMKSLRLDISYQEIEEMFDIADINKDGKIDKQEFEVIYMSYIAIDKKIG